MMPPRAVADPCSLAIRSGDQWAAIMPHELNPQNEMKTTETKHSPSPWAADYSGPAHLAVTDASGRTIAFGNLQCEDGDEDEANIRLMALAPELLAALEDAQQALAHAIHRLKDDPSFSTSIALKRAEDNARAAIAKAKGGAL